MYALADILVSSRPERVDPLAHLRLRVNRRYCDEEYIMSIGTILLIVLILMLVGVLPTRPQERL
jgi:hypothetical protein